MDLLFFNRRKPGISSSTFSVDLMAASGPVSITAVAVATRPARKAVNPTIEWLNLMDHWATMRLVDAPMFGANLNRKRALS